MRRRRQILRARCRPLGVLAVLVVLSAPGDGARAAPTRRVLIVASYGREFSPYNSLIGAFKSELARRSTDPIEFHEASLEMARFSEGEAERPFVEFLRAQFAPRRLDLVVPVGGAAARFWQRHHGDLFPSVPTLIAGVDLRILLDVTLDAEQTAVASRLDLPGTVESILHLLPQTAHIAVVIGDSPLERYWVSEAKREWQPFTDRVHFTWWNALSFVEIRRQAATLPPGSAILYMMMTVDAQGVPYEGDQALETLHAAANVPIFGFFAAQLGRGIVGGQLIDAAEIGNTAVGVALEILGGEPPGNIRIATIEPGTPTYDWRELRRWNIPTASLPPGSNVVLRVLTPWEKYRWRIVLGLGVIAAQGLALAGLLVQRARRRRAELESQQRRRELLHATRLSTVGELTASLAHELHQPLGAILRNAEAAELLMQRSPADLEELRAIVADIRQDDARAVRVIDRLRALLKRHDLESRHLGVGELFEEVWMLSKFDAASRGVRLQMDAPADLPHVHGDRVHLVQVLLNLIANAMDASRDTPASTRGVSVRAQHRDGLVEIVVSDTGHGIPAADLERVFEPFHTTKPNGLGLGLSISRTIVEAHGGRIWASNNPDRGATFQFTLPIEGRGNRR